MSGWYRIGWSLGIAVFVLVSSPSLRPAEAVVRASGSAHREAQAERDEVAGSDEAEERARVEQRITDEVEALLLRIWKPAVAACVVAGIALAAAVRRRWGAATATPVGIRPLMAGVLLAVFCMMAFYASGGFLAVGLSRSMPEMSHPITAVLAPGIALAAALWLCRKGLGRPLVVLGLHGRHAPSAIGWSLLLYVAQLPVFYALMVLGNEVFAPRLQDPIVHIARNHDLAFRGLFLLAVGLVVPLFEEVVFRGLLFDLLRRRLGVWAAVLASALLFMAVHPPQTYFPIFWLGVLLALAYHYTGTLLAPVALHGVHNALQFGLVLWAASAAGT